MPSASRRSSLQPQRGASFTSSGRGAGAGAPSARPDGGAGAHVRRRRWREEKEILSLKDEIKNLKLAIESMKQVPAQQVINHPGAQFGLNYELSQLFQKLILSGF